MTYKLLREGPIELGRLPERLLFPRNLFRRGKMLAFSTINSFFSP
jgi:hypothetical protein